MVNVHIISYHVTGPSPKKFKSTQGQHNWPAIAKNLWVEDAGCHICLQMLGNFLSQLGGVGFEVSETYKLQSQTIKPCLFHNSWLEHFGAKLTSYWTPRAWKRKKMIFPDFLHVIFGCAKILDNFYTTYGIWGDWLQSLQVVTTFMIKTRHLPGGQCV